MKKLLSEFSLVAIFLLGLGVRFSQIQGSSDESYSDLKKWLFRDALNVRFKAGWKEKDCNIWGFLPNCLHTGIDFTAPADTPVYSVADGTVVRAEPGRDCQSDDCLSVVAIYNEPTHVTFIYLHMRGVKVSRDDTIKAGQQIGGVGMRGRATNFHLHFEARERYDEEKGKYVPAYWPANDAKNTLDPYEAAKKAREYISVEPITWREYRLGALSYSIPSDWKLWKEGDALRRYYRDQQNRMQYQSLGGVQRMYYEEKNQIGFIISVIDEEKGIESGTVRIIHYDECGGKKVEEPAMMSQRTINITHMGCLVDSFKAKVAGYPVMVCILRADRSISSTYWTFTLIKGGKRYIFHLTSTDPEYQRTIFQQLTSRIRLGAY